MIRNRSIDEANASMKKNTLSKADCVNRKARLKAKPKKLPIEIQETFGNISIEPQSGGFSTASSTVSSLL